MRELEDARYKAIGARIRDVRIEKNMSQAELAEKPHAIIYHKFMKFSTACVRKFGKNNYIEILINPISRKLAIAYFTLSIPIV